MIQKSPKETIAKETKVISIYRKRKNILMAIATVLVFFLMIPIAYKANTKKNKEIDELTLENYLAQEANLNQNKLIG